jgi:hypothetical protein
MSAELVAIMAAIAAVQARIAGMQVANASIDLQAYPPRYDEHAFLVEAHQLEQLAIHARNCQ